MSPNAEQHWITMQAATHHTASLDSSHVDFPTAPDLPESPLSTPVTTSMSSAVVWGYPISQGAPHSSFSSDGMVEARARDAQGRSDNVTADSDSSMANFVASSSPSDGRGSLALPHLASHDTATVPQSMGHFYLDGEEAIHAFSQIAPDISRPTSSSANSAPELGTSPHSDLDEDPRRSISAAGSAGTTLSTPTGTALSGSNRRLRHKCTPEQVQALSAFFDNNRNPTGKMRQELAHNLDMPERSVQIWFQNKRAKLKHRGDAKDNSPSSGKTHSPSSRRPSRRSSKTSLSHAPYEKNGGPECSRLSRSRSNLDITESITQIPAVSLSIGSWRRVRPLTCFFSRKIETLAWTLRSDSVGFKLECPSSSITEITFNGPVNPSMSEVAEGIYEPLGLMSVRLERPPTFFMEVFRSASRPGESEPGGAMWRQCEDFTEARQGTQNLLHVISGPYQALREALLRLKESSADLAEHLHLHDQPEINGGPYTHDGPPSHRQEGLKAPSLLRQASGASLRTDSRGMPAAAAEHAGAVMVPGSESSESMQSHDYSSLPPVSYVSADLPHSSQAFHHSAFNNVNFHERFSPGGRNADLTMSHQEGQSGARPDAFMVTHGGGEAVPGSEGLAYPRLDASANNTSGPGAGTGFSGGSAGGAWGFDDHSSNAYNSLYFQGTG